MQAPSQHAAKPRQSSSGQGDAAARSKERGSTEKSSDSSSDGDKARGAKGDSPTGSERRESMMQQILSLNNAQARGIARSQTVSSPKSRKRPFQKTKLANQAAAMASASSQAQPVDTGSPESKATGRHFPALILRKQRSLEVGAIYPFVCLCVCCVSVSAFYVCMCLSLDLSTSPRWLIGLHCTCVEMMTTQDIHSNAEYGTVDEDARIDNLDRFKKLVLGMKDPIKDLLPVRRLVHTCSSPGGFTLATPTISAMLKNVIESQFISQTTFPPLVSFPSPLPPPPFKFFFADTKPACHGHASSLRSLGL